MQGNVEPEVLGLFGVLLRVHSDLPKKVRCIHRRVAFEDHGHTAGLGVERPGCWPASCNQLARWIWHPLPEARVEKKRKNLKGSGPPTRSMDEQSTSSLTRGQPVVIKSKFSGPGKST